MGKKKGRRQVDPGREDCESTDEEASGEQESFTSCPHTGKAVSLSAIKKTLKTAWVRVGQCAPCLREKKTGNRPQTLPKAKPGAKKTLQEQKREQLERARQEQINAAAMMKKSQSEKSAASEKPAATEPAPGGDSEKDGDTAADKDEVVVWLCLKCGSQSCGEKCKNHCEQHYRTPRSELHCLFVNTENWEIFCWECGKEIYIDSHKKLYEAVEFIKKTKEKPNKQLQPSMKSMSMSVSLNKLTGKEFKDQANAAVQSGLLPKVKGLSNLGNTCFFNSVMQCLSQTHPLTQLIDIQTSKGANLNLKVLDSNEGTLSEDENENLGTFTVPELSLQLPEGGPMMTSLAAFLKDMHSNGKSSTISPSHLFGQVVKQSPKFRGMQQQDSQELLRYLMDGLRNEESKRQKTAVLKHFGLTEKTDPKTVSRNIRKKIRLYGRTGNHTLLDKLFSGQMVSTIVCEECHYSSQTYEPFLDLSLPVMEDKPHKPRGRGPGMTLPDDEDSVQVTCCGVQEEKKSKGKAKKEKLRKKKENRKTRKEGTKDEEKIQEDIKETETKEVKVESVIVEVKDSKPAVSPTTTAVVPQTLPPITPLITQMAAKINKDATPTTSRRREEEKKTSWRDGNEEDDEEEGYEEGEEDWEWDYGETWEGGEKDQDDEEEDDKGEESDYIEYGEEENAQVEEKPRVPLQSLNPLPPEMISFEHEKSSERTTGASNSDQETGASSNADVEDNDSDESRRNWTANSRNLLLNMSKLNPVQLNPLNLDPHMEVLCKGIKLLNTECTEIQQKEDSVPKEEVKDPAVSEGSNYHTAESEQREATNKETEKSSEDEMARLRNEWTARTLVSLAPRYGTSSGECSVYSCLNKFTQSELLTGSNKWACDSCTTNRSKEDETDSTGSERSRRTVYSNASKQFLIFSPPMILTLHLKRFQQTLVGCRKINKHVVFPLTLDLAPFCSSTSLSMPLMKANQTKVLYSLYGVVEHSGRLQGGHYTAFVKVRPANTSNRDASDFFSPPLSRSSDIPRFLKDMQAKFHQFTDQESQESDPPSPRRWFHISDTSVSEVSEDKVLKAQAYLLFYERIL